MPLNREEFLRWEERSRDTIDVKRAYVDMAGGDLVAGVLLSQIVYWFLPSKITHDSKLHVERDGATWLAKGREAWWEEARISPYRFDRAIGILEALRLVTIRVWHFRNLPATHITINWDVFLPAHADAINAPLAKPPKQGDRLKVLPSTKRGKKPPEEQPPGEEESLGAGPPAPHEVGEADQELPDLQFGENRNGTSANEEGVNQGKPELQFDSSPITSIHETTLQTTSEKSPPTPSVEGETSRQLEEAADGRDRENEPPTDYHDEHDTATPNEIPGLHTNQGDSNGTTELSEEERAIFERWDRFESGALTR
jgi:hypothetical protein